MKNTWGKGICDPHIYIFNDKAYMYASHDESSDSTEFIMPDWCIYSSNDLVTWKEECVLKPEDTYIEKPTNTCWATDAVCKDGKYYWVFSDMCDGKSQIGIVEGDTPIGPWVDRLKKPLIPSNDDYSVYDPALYKEGEEVYIIFGKGDYYIAKMSDDMQSLAEAPRELIVNNPAGPYGEGWTDDKPYLHYYDGNYYLSWGAFYAMSKNLYGPYDYTGCIVLEENIDPAFKTATWPNGFKQGRHGNFFRWNNQWYFTYCDMSGSGNRYYRDSWISYVHYKSDGTIAPIKIEECGVGQYFADREISAACYFSAKGVQKFELTDNVFGVRVIEDNAELCYPNILNCEDEKTLCIKFASQIASSIMINISVNGEVRRLELLPNSTQLELSVKDIKDLKLTFPKADKKPILKSIKLI